ncbi:class I tRNA ligase family protein [Pseudolabrys taiwanensis]|nr:class I tRNA ligase family protein [Pseudolabrys taiwanensis]
MSGPDARAAAATASYDAAAVEAKWQARWADAGCFKATADERQRKFFNFDGGPFPNGALHMGHVRTFTLGDVMARYRRMCGDAVLYCFEFDAFGLPNELAANALGIAPEELTRRNIAQMTRQMIRLGLSYDWDHVVTTCDPAYYRWTQWLFLKLRERGLVYRMPAELNWCPSCHTTLAHMQVDDGCCWRCDTPVESRKLTQWFVALGRYSAILSDSLERMEGFSPRVRNVLQGFIGKTPGLEFDFVIRGHPEVTLTAFARAEYVDAVPSYLAVAPGHPALADLLTRTQADALRPMNQRRRAQAAAQPPLDGFDTGLEAVEAHTGVRLPVFVARHVDPAFATGVEIGYPAADPRARQFAERHKIACAPPNAGSPLKGRPATHYRVRDWLVSRQRAWGTPIPIVHCEACGEVPVPEQALPVRVPILTPNLPPGGLAAVPGFAAAQCPCCGKPARRETDTLDCYFDVVWCFLACANGLKPDFKFQASDFADWTPVDWFHNGLDSLFYMHLYRFLGQVLHEMAVLPEPEPIRCYIGHDAVLLDGRKMSKHHGNVVSPDAVIEKEGADVLRVHVLWSANPLKSVEWSQAGLQRAKRLLLDVWKLVTRHALEVRTTADAPPMDASAQPSPLDKAAARAARRVTEFLERYQYAGCLQEIQTLIVRLEAEAERLSNRPSAPRDSFANGIRCLVTMLAPFAPHMAEELWEEIGGKDLVARAPWPILATDAPHAAMPKNPARGQREAAAP